MRAYLVTFVAGLSLSSLAAAADPAPVAPAAPAVAVAPEKEKKICKMEETTGSIMSKRVCHTKAEWATMQNQDDANSDRALSAVRRGRVGSGLAQ